MIVNDFNSSSIVNNSINKELRGLPSHCNRLIPFEPPADIEDDLFLFSYWEPNNIGAAPNI